MSKQFSILTDHEVLIGASKYDKSTQTAQYRLTRWAEKLLPFDFTVEHLPGNEMGFVDYLSKHPSGEPEPVSHDDENFFISSVNQITTLLGFEHLMPRYSRPQLKNKFLQQLFSHDVIFCNAIGQPANNKSSEK